MKKETILKFIWQNSGDSKKDRRRNMFVVFTMVMSLLALGMYTGGLVEIVKAVCGIFGK